MSKSWHAALVGILALTIGVAHAQAPTNCANFKWDITRERGWILASTGALKSGDSFALAPKGFKVALAPDAQLHFAAPPERAPLPGRFGAILTLQGLPKPGVYQIALANEAWIDIVENGKSLKSIDFSGQKNCPGVRKSVRFKLTDTHVILQISNAPHANTRIAVAAKP